MVFVSRMLTLSRVNVTGASMVNIVKTVTLVTTVHAITMEFALQKVMTTVANVEQDGPVPLVKRKIVATPTLVYMGECALHMVFLHINAIVPRVTKGLIVKLKH